MRLLHTSDWHLGRRLHGVDLTGAQEAFLDHLVVTVREVKADVLVHSGDVFDRSQPGVDSLRLLGDALLRLRDCGVTTVMISGNHDAPGRLGDKAGLLDPRVRIRTEVDRLAEPVTVTDRFGPVHFYALPYLEPAAVGHLLAPDPEQAAFPLPLPGAAGEHQRVLAAATDSVHRDRASRGGRSVVLAHAWVVGGEATDSERDITVGGLAQASARLFDGVDYVALGHLHRPQALDRRMRYAGSPLAYSFSEAGQVKSSWLVELGADGCRSVEAVPVPTQRPLSVLTGELAVLMADPALAAVASHYLSVVLTDTVRPVDAMAVLQRRFPHAVALEWRPPPAAADGLTYRERMHGRTELEIAGSFVEHVRSPVTDVEREVLAAALEQARRGEDAA